MTIKQNYKVIGLMSGTSLDGIDIAYCEFNFEKKWSFDLINHTTINYDNKWKSILRSIHNSSAEEISKVDSVYGSYLGSLVKKFCSENNLFPDFVSSHGHTIFHQPQNGFTKQIGAGANLSASSGYDVVCDFRAMDVALGGQGAPLVPIGDKLLFSDYDYCLNLGGIANISFDREDKRFAYDICACNLVLNYFADKIGLPFDEDGKLAASGITSVELLNELNKLNYYSKKFPKSLGREDVDENIIPLFEKYNLKIEDALATFCVHMAHQISENISESKTKNKMLVTGGGAFNKFLMKKISDISKINIVIPSSEIINFKEAIIFAFLGVLRIRNEINCLSSVTGASRDNCGGAVFKI